VPSCGKHTLIGGIGAYWVDPHVENDEAFVVFANRTDGITTTNQTRSEAYSYDTEVVPYVWLGVVGAEGYGVRGRAWWFDTNSAAGAALGSAPPTASVTGANISIFSSTVPGALATISVANSVQLCVYDLEGMGTLTYGPLQISYFGGARYLTSKEQITGQSFQPGTGTFSYTVVGATSSDFEGVGPLMGYEARYPVYGGMSLYNSVRVALVFGHAQEHRSTLGQYLSGEIISFGNNSAEDTDLRRTGELEIGGEWRGDMAGNGLFLRAAWVGITTENVALTGLSLAAGLQR
jgi:hypothetical protein